jgi:hypothetical protein
MVGTISSLRALRSRRETGILRALRVGRQRQKIDDAAVK